MHKRVCWIDDIAYSDASPNLRAIYDRVMSPNGHLDHLYRGFSLSPQTILPADNLYKAVLHDNDAVLPSVFAELIGTYVAMLADCHYALAHHEENYIKLSEDTQHAEKTLDALSTDNLNDCGSEKEIVAIKYVKKLCLSPSEIVRDDIETLRAAGWSDKEISEVVQVVAMFSYFVRVINGVGIELGDEKLGLY